ncbi:MAG: hypothetical protein RJA69_1059 [Pseudomonadota bacterium]
MVSITRCWRSPPHEAGTRAWALTAWRGVVARVLLGLLMIATGVQAQAPQGQPIQLEDVQVQRLDDGYYVNAGMQIEWPVAVEDALSKGVPLHFVARVDILRERWYWYDREVARQERYMRLSYQPLTRRWRLLVSSQPIGNTGLGVSLGQSFDSASEAVAALGRINRWKVAELSQVDADGKHRVDFSFRLDLTQLPRPLQLGVLGESDWNLGISRTFKLTADSK